LEFVRQLGHKFEIPGSGQWKMFTDKENALHTCWVCDQWIYSLVFWSPSIGVKNACDYKKINFDLRDKFIQTVSKNSPVIEPLNPLKPKDIIEERNLKLMSYYEEDENRPFIIGEFTDWQPKRMVRIDEFA
jgi:hypothetical protein